MIKLNRPLYSRICQVTGTLLFFLFGVLTGVGGQGVLMLGLFASALVYYFMTGHLVRVLARAGQEGFLLNGRAIQAQKLAAIGELSAGIAHEINNPLGIIAQEVALMQELLKTNPQGDPRHAEDFRESLRHITVQVERCKEIIHKLLDFARRTEPVIQRVDINRLIEDMARLVEREASLNNIQIVREYDQNMPPVTGDSPLLRQVLLNLLNNAVQAIDREGTITVQTVRTGDDAYQIAVSDTGCGIPREQLNKIFEPFFTTKPPGKGTGLGLAICHGIIGKLGGRMQVSSQVGQGTTFTITLPMKR